VTSAPRLVGEQFDDLEQQQEACSLGMWVFLCTEILLFGGLFLSYAVYRHAYPQAFHDASHDAEYWIGTSNTAVLLISSLWMALSVHCARTGRRKLLLLFLALTLIFGLAFLGLKGLEYYLDYKKNEVPGINLPVTDAFSRQKEMFWTLYFFMTGLHAFHLTIGCGLVALILILAWRTGYNAKHYAPVEVTGLYWHFIDIVWVFLYPLIYLPGRH